MGIIFLIIIAALFLGSAVLYAMNLHWWRVSLIAGVLFGSVALIWVPGEYGPADRLKPGIDLAGGTRLVYDVVVPDGQTPGRVIEQTIEILSDRVDPSGTRGLVWREVAGQRIEVQMASAPANVREAHDAYKQARRQLEQSNLTPIELEAALRSDDPQSLVTLSEGNAELLRDLEDLKTAYDAREEARRLYYQADARWLEIQQTIPEDEWATNGAYTTLVQEEIAYNQDAVPAFVEIEDRVLDTYSFNIAEFDFLTEIPAQTLSEEARAAGEVTPREERLAKLKADYPRRADAIQAAYDALVAYEAVKGPLDSAEDLITLLRGSGVLEFRIAADPAMDGLDEYTEQLDTMGPRVGAEAPYRWFEVDDLTQYVDDDEERAQVEEWLRLSLSLDQDELAQSRQAISGFFDRRSSRETHGVVARPYAGRLYLLLHDGPGMSMTRNDDWAVSNVQRSMTDLGRPVVSFGLDGRGASLMSGMTTPNVNAPMAVLIDDKVLTTPNINEPLRKGVQISGDFSEAEVNYLRDTMRAGALEGQLSENPVSQLTIGATLGADNIKAGLRAALTSLVLVAIFMAIYYYFAGLIANFALAANMILILGVLAMTQATFTLPGIAGLVLTIGMAVDANVLIFERIREELMDRKVSISIAVRQGYGKALSTILDANITTLITCLILGYTATSDVKGFAVVLGIGILATLFTALFCTKVLLDLYIRYAKPKTLQMLPTMFPAIHRFFSPNVNWIGKAKYLVPISALLLFFGLGEALFQRGTDMLDIEFRSGTSVGFELKPTGELDVNGEPILTSMNITDARNKIVEVGATAAAIQDAREAGQTFTPANDQEREIMEAVNNAYERAAQEEAKYEELLASGDERIVLDGVPDFGLLSDIQIVTTGQAGSSEMASGFNVATLITDSKAITDLMQIAFEDELETTRSISFTGDNLSAKDATGVVQLLETGVLGDAFNGLPDRVAGMSLPEYRGGVAIYVQDMSEPLSIEAITERINRQRNRPPHDQYGSRTFDVIGVDRGEGFDAANKPVYNSVIVIARHTNPTATTQTVNAETFAVPGSLADTEWQLLKESLGTGTSFSNVTKFSGQVSGTMQQQAIVAIFLSLLAVVIYIWIRFGSFRYGLAAIAALVHDVAVALGVIALAGLAFKHLPPDSLLDRVLMLEPFKINLAMIAAFLTIIGYSLNDTIVVFDRIRENRGRLSRATPQIINDSINQTISRTVLTSGTTLIAVGTLYIVGGPGVHGFAFAMLVGILVGTYSSIAIAAPILLIGTKGKGPTGGPADKPATTPADPDIVSESVTA